MPQQAYIGTMRVTHGKTFVRLHPLRSSSFARSNSDLQLNGSGKHGTSNVKDYMENFLAMLYYTCLIPFKLKRKDQVLILEQNTLQQILCAIVHTLAVFYQTIEVTNDLQERVEKEPQQIFTICFGIADWLYLCWAVFTVWSEPPKFLRLTEQLTSTRTLINGRSKHQNLKHVMICGIPIFATTLDIFHYVFVNEGKGGPTWNNYSDVTDYLQELPVFSFLQKQTAWVQRASEVVYFASMLANLFFYNCLDAFLFTLTLCGYEIASKFLEMGTETKSGMARHRLDTVLMKPNYLISDSLQLKIYFETINNIASGFYLFWFCSFCPWAALHLMQSLPGLEEVELTLYNWFYITYYGLIMTFCVKTKRKVDTYKDKIYEALFQHDMFPSTSTNTLNYVDYLLKDVGFKGGQFFILSHSFVGSTVGTVVTYAFLALQFQLTPTMNGINASATGNRSKDNV